MARWLVGGFGDFQVVKMAIGRRASSAAKCVENRPSSPVRPDYTFFGDGLKSARKLVCANRRYAGCVLQAEVRAECLDEARIESRRDSATCDLACFRGN